MSKPILRISIFFLLMFALQTISVVAQTKPQATGIKTNQGTSKITIPATISAWLDTELSKAKRKKLLTKEQFFTRESAKVVGYIKDFRPDLGFKTITVDATNNSTRESRPIVAEIDSTGRFCCIIPMNHPQKLTISFKKIFMTLYLEPGQVLALSFDWNDCEKTDGFHNISNPADYILFKGPLAKINYELLSFQLKSLGYRHYYIKGTYNPQQYLAVIDTIFTDNNAIINQALKAGKISKQAIDIQKNEALLRNAFYLIDYAISKTDEGVQIPPSFYNVLQQLPLNDPTTTISEVYSGFINRFEFNPVLMKAYRNLGSINSTSELHQKIWSNRDSLLKSDLKLTSGFTYEETKIRSLSNEIEKMGKNEAYAYFAKVSEGIKTPFLREEGLRILKSNFGKAEIRSTDGKINLPLVSSSTESRWVPLSLPKSKDADIFSKLIAPYKGKYLFVDFWGTSCGPCRWGIEEKTKTREKYKINDKFDFVFITSKMWSPDKKEYEKYVAEQGLVNSYFVSDDDYNYLMQLFRFNGVPHYVFVNPDGKILDTDFEMFLGFEDARKWIQGN